MSDAAEKEKAKAAFKGSLGDAITDDDVTFIAIDDANQLLEFRFGPVYSEDGELGHGLWISYQRRAYETDELGPFLMSPETFDHLVEHVKRRKEQWKDFKGANWPVKTDVSDESGKK